MKKHKKFSTEHAPKALKFDSRDYFYPPECPSCGTIDHDYRAFCEICNFWKFPY